MIGNFITKQRKKFEWSQTKLGKMIGVKQPLISDYEHEKRIPHANHLIQICTAFGLSESEIADWLHKLGHPTQEAIDLTNEASRELHHALWDLAIPPEIKDQLNNTVTTVVHACREIAKERTYQYPSYSAELLQTFQTQHAKVEEVSQQLIAQLTVNEIRACLHQNQLDLADKLLQLPVIQNVKRDRKPYEIFLEVSLLEGDVYMEYGKWNKAIDLYQEISSLSDGHYPLHHAQANRRLAKLSIFRGEFIPARDKLHAALSSLNAVEDKYERANVLAELSLLDSIRGQTEEARKHIKAALNIAEALNNDYLRMRGYSGSGHIYRQTNEWQKAKEKFAKAEALAEKLDDKREEGWILLGIGRIEYFKGVDCWRDAKTEEMRNQARHHLRNAYEKFRAAAELLYQKKYQYRYELARLLMGKVILEDLECRFLCLEEITDEHQCSDVYNFNHLAQVRAIYNKVLDGFESMNCKYYVGKVLQYLCELSCKAADFEQTNINNPVNRADKEIEGHIRRLHELGPVPQNTEYDHNYPQHMARAMVEYAMIAIKQGHLRLAVERFGVAFCYANSFNQHLEKEILAKLDQTIDPVRRITRLHPDDVEYLAIPHHRGPTIRNVCFYRKLATLLEIKKDKLSVSCSEERMKRLGLIIETMEERASEIDMNRFP